MGAGSMPNQGLTPTGLGSGGCAVPRRKRFCRTSALGTTPPSAKVILRPREPEAGRPAAAEPASADRGPRERDCSRDEAPPGPYCRSRAPRTMVSATHGKREGSTPLPPAAAAEEVAPLAPAAGFSKCAGGTVAGCVGSPAPAAEEVAPLAPAAEEVAPLAQASGFNR